MTEYNEIFVAAQGLSPPDRVRLIDSLSETVAIDEWPLPSEAWIAEAQRRSQELDAGRMTTSTWEEVQARARKKVGLDA